MSEQISVTVKPDGTYRLQMPAEIRNALRSLIDQFEVFLDPQLPESKRLFPTAYPDDPERDAGYQIFSQDKLIEKKQGSMNTIRETLEAQTLTVEQTQSWLQTINDLRLVIGTQLDVCEEDFVPDDPELYELYEDLTYLSEIFVRGLSGGLNSKSKKHRN